MTTPTLIRALSTVALASTTYAHTINGDNMHYLLIINVMALFGLVVTTIQDMADEEVRDDR